MCEESSSLPIPDGFLYQGVSSNLLGPIFDSLPFYVMLLDKNHRILFANKATVEHLGFLPSEIVGKYCPEVVHGIKEGFFPGCPLEESVVYKRAAVKEFFDEKSRKWLKSAVYPTGAFLAEDEEIYVHVTEDISERKFYEEGLERGEVELKKALNRIAEMLPRYFGGETFVEVALPAGTDTDISLTDREKQVLKLMAQGHSNNEIAQEMRVDEKTIRNYSSKILKKLHQKNRVSAILCAHRKGLIKFTAD